MAAYRRVYDSRHLQADLPRTGISSGTLRSVIEYWLPLCLLFVIKLAFGTCGEYD